MLNSSRARKTGAGGSDAVHLMLRALKETASAKFERNNSRLQSAYQYEAARTCARADLVTGGNTHAWVQVYVPGPGWVDFDPSSGMVGNWDLVRVAVAHEPREAIPPARDMDRNRVGPSRHEVAVKVAAQPDAGTGRGR